MTITYQNSTSAATSGTTAVTVSPTAHSGLAAGNLLVAAWDASWQATDTQTLPTGFVQLEKAGPGTATENMIVAVKIATGAETQFDFTNSVARHQAVWVDRWTGTFDATVLNNIVDSTLAESLAVSQTTYVAPSVDSLGATNTLVACSFGSLNATGAGRSYNNSVTEIGVAASLTTIRRAHSASKMQAAAGLTGATTLTDTSNRWIAVTTVIKEVAAAATSLIWEPVSPLTRTLRSM